MSSQPKAVSPLRQRMIEDMRMRKLAPQTQAAYIRAVRKFARYLNRAPDSATAEDLPNFQLHLVDHGASPITLNATITGLKFFFGVTLDRGALMAKMQHVFVPRTLPVVLSRDEVKRLIAAAGNLKYQTALSVAYGAGLRASEVIALRITDVDSQRMVLRVQQGQQGPLRDALAGDARAAAHLVPSRPRPGQDAEPRNSFVTPSASQGMAVAHELIR